MAVRAGFVNHVGVVSGAEESLLTLLAHLDRRRIEPLLFCPDGPLARRAAALGVSVHPVPFGRLHRRGGAVERARSCMRLAGAALHLLRGGERLDVLHANSASAALAALPLHALRGVPLVWHVRDLLLPPGLVRRLAGPVSAAVAISRAVAERLRHDGFPAERMRVIPNALDPALRRPTRERDEVRAELGFAPDDVVAIAVGQLVPWKGHDLLLEAFARAAPIPAPSPCQGEGWGEVRSPRGGRDAELPPVGVGPPPAPSLARRGSTEVRLVIVGTDLFGEHAEYVAALKRRATEPDLAGRVVLTGYRGDVPDLLAAADLLVLPSRGEPFGRVLLEGMAAGLPVVATRPGGPCDIVLSGRTGLLVPQDDAAAMAAGLMDVVSMSADERRRMGAAGRRRVLSRFRPESHAAAMGELLEQVAAGARR
ncbi:MAG: glycosyltransferase [Armatimonadetes bacterium]|nr:glycosyltransferase [Armatimonadota bacterium]